MTKASENLMKYINEGRLIRKQWTGIDKQGRDTACLLAAMSDEVKIYLEVALCPADIMPEWLAHLTVFIDDEGTVEQWPSVVRRYAGLAGRWHALDAAAWQRADYGCRKAAVVEAMKRTDDAKALQACRTVIDLCDKAIAGGTRISDDWLAATDAAADAHAASRTAAAAAAAYAASRTAAAAAYAASRTADPAYADRIITDCLDCIEAEIVSAEAHH